MHSINSDRNLKICAKQCEVFMVRVTRPLFLQFNCFFCSFHLTRLSVTQKSISYFRLSRASSLESSIKFNWVRFG